MSRIIYTLFGIGILVIAWYVSGVFNSGFEKGTEVNESGIIRENVINSGAGQPMLLKVKRDDGSEFEVIYHDGKGPCPNKESTYMQLKPETNVSIYGIAIDDDTISLCGSDTYNVQEVS